MFPLAFPWSPLHTIASLRVKDAVLRHVRGLIGLPAQELLDRRLEKYLKMGVYLEETATAAAGPTT